MRTQIPVVRNWDRVARTQVSVARHSGRVARNWNRIARTQVSVARNWGHVARDFVRVAHNTRPVARPRGSVARDWKRVARVERNFGVRSPTSPMDYDPTIQDKFEFCLSLRFELPLGIRVASDRSVRIHRAWGDATMTAMPKAFHDGIAALGGVPALWLLLPDVLSPTATVVTFDEFRSELAKVAPAKFRDRVLKGLLRDDELIGEALGTNDLAKLLNGSIMANAWLTAVGLFPAKKTTPFVVALGRLIRDPAAILQQMLPVIDAFWASGFERTWREAQPQLRRSMETSERFFRSCSLAEFAHRQVLRLVVNERAQELRATRSEDHIPFKRLKVGYVMPSMFNHLRTWTSFEGDGDARPAVIHLSCFDPAIGDLAG